MRIGITERGDAGIDMQWVPKMKSGFCDGAVLITKNITSLFAENVIRCQTSGMKFIIHATCTGWGGTWTEPNVPGYKDQLRHLAELCDRGFPLKNCVLRIDPIIPSKKGLQLVREVLANAEDKGILPTARIRVSVYDEYLHVKKRLNRTGFQSFYPGYDFQASEEQFEQVADLLSEYDYTFHTCAEPVLKQKEKKEGQIVQSGCISKQDLVIMGLKVPYTMSVNRQSRNGCICPVRQNYSQKGNSVRINAYTVIGKIPEIDKYRPLMLSWTYTGSDIRLNRTQGFAPYPCFFLKEYKNSQS